MSQQENDKNAYETSRTIGRAAVATGAVATVIGVSSMVYNEVRHDEIERENYRRVRGTTKAPERKKAPAK